MRQSIIDFIVSNDTSIRNWRIVIGGSLSIAVSFIPQLLAHFSLDGDVQVFIAAACMLILKELKDLLRNNIEESEEQRDV